MFILVRLHLITDVKAKSLSHNNMPGCSKSGQMEKHWIEAYLWSISILQWEGIWKEEEEKKPKNLLFVGDFYLWSNPRQSTFIPGVERLLDKLGALQILISLTYIIVSFPAFYWSIKQQTIWLLDQLTQCFSQALTQTSITSWAIAVTAVINM